LGTLRHFTQLILTWFDKVGQGWPRLDKNGPVWTRLDKVGQGWTRLDKVGQGWTTLDMVQYFLIPIVFIFFADFKKRVAKEVWYNFRINFASEMVDL
jgi:hypothetical protein